MRYRGCLGPARPEDRTIHVCLGAVTLQVAVVLLIPRYSTVGR